MKSSYPCAACRVRCRSRKGAWIEIAMLGCEEYAAYRRSRKGAWIEMLFAAAASLSFKVAPVRERGLKFLTICRIFLPVPGRSRKGAWIEMSISDYG